VNHWADAAAAAQAVIDSKAYSLVPDATTVAREEQERTGAHLRSSSKGHSKSLYHAVASGASARAGRITGATPEFMDTFLTADLRKKPTFPDVAPSERPRSITTVGTVRGFGDRVRGSCERRHTTASSTTTAGNPSRSTPADRTSTGRCIGMPRRCSGRSGERSAGRRGVRRDQRRGRAGLPALAGLTQAQFRRGAARAELGLAFESSASSISSGGVLYSGDRRGCGIQDWLKPPTSGRRFRSTRSTSTPA
jgi:hypothetical protein